MRPFTAFEQENVRFLVNLNVRFTQVEITPTGLFKSILDATAPMRAYFLEEGIHNYEEQRCGIWWSWGCRENELIKGACAKNKKKAVLPFAFRCLIERFCSAPYKERRFAFTMGKPLEGLVVKGS